MRQLESSGGARATVVALVVSSALCTLFCVSASFKTWPLIDGDGTAYFPAAVELSAGRSLTNPVWLPPLNDSLDGPGGRRYIYHGYLYQLTIGAVGRGFGGGPRASVSAAYLLHWLAAIAGTLAILRWAEVTTKARVFLAAVLPLSILGLSVAWHGRVEPLAILIISLACLVMKWLKDEYATATAAAATVLLAFTSPICGALAVALALAWWIVSAEHQHTLTHTLAAIGAGGAAAALAIVVYPFPIADWVNGVFRHSRINASLPFFQGIVPTWFTRSELPLLAVSFGVLTTGAIYQFVARCRSVNRIRGAVAGAFVLLFAGGLIRFAFLKSEAAYNAVVWMPLLACVALATSHSIRATSVIIIALALPATGLVRSSLVLARQFRQDAVPFADVVTKIRDLEPLGCSVSSGLWLASDDGRDAHVDPTGSARTRFYIQQQTNTGRGLPPEVPGYQLIANHFGPPVTAFGLPLSRTPGGWEFAVYERRP